MLTLPGAFRDRIIAHARRDHPDECCGIVTAVDGRPARLIELINAERSPTGFSFESGEWLRVNREMDDRDEDLLVVYHSHTMTPAEPSRTDIRFANGATGPTVNWLLVSTRSEVDEIRSFRIDGETVTEEELCFTDG